MKVKILGAHNSESKYTKFITFIIDNQIAIDAGCLSSELEFSDQEKIKIILLTHSHYDHVKEILSFAFNNRQRTTDIYATKETQDIFSTHFLDGTIYPNFTKKNSFLKIPVLKFRSIESEKSFLFRDYTISPFSMNHIPGSVGYHVISKDGKSLFFTGDTGPNPSSLWKHILPDLLIIEVTFPNKLEESAINSKHLCPILLKKELLKIKKIHHKLPQILLVHSSPKYKDSIESEIKLISEELNHPLEFAYEGQVFQF